MRPNEIYYSEETNTIIVIDEVDVTEDFITYEYSGFFKTKGDKSFDDLSSFIESNIRLNYKLIGTL